MMRITQFALYAKAQIYTCTRSIGAPVLISPNLLIWTLFSWRLDLRYLFLLLKTTHVSNWFIVSMVNHLPAIDMHPPLQCSSTTEYSIICLMGKETDVVGIWVSLFISCIANISPSGPCWIQAEVISQIYFHIRCFISLVNLASHNMLGGSV